MDDGGASSPESVFSTSAWPIVAVAPAGIWVEDCHVFKTRLQEYAMKVGIPTPEQGRAYINSRTKKFAPPTAPEYHTLKEGPGHEPVFRSTVFVNNTSYESLPGFFRRKAAEQSAAEVALMEIAMSAPLTESRHIRALQQTGLCKNLLQEYAQKMNYAIPSYICTKQASGVAPFICRVEIGGIIYIGAAARTKKEAEIKAARTALLAIHGQSEGGANVAIKYNVVPGQRPHKGTDKEPIETPIPLQVRKKHGFIKRKWNKRKFNRTAEKDVEEGLGMPVQYDHEEARRTENVLSRDTGMVQFNKEVLMMQPGEGDMVFQPEPPKDPAEVQHNKEARSVEQDLPNNTEVVKPNNEAITIEHESASASLALLSNGDSTDVKEAPSSKSMAQGEELVTTMQAPHTGDRVQLN